MVKQLELEIEGLVKKAEEVDSSNNDNGLSIPEEIKRREKRIDALKKCKRNYRRALIISNYYSIL